MDQAKLTHYITASLLKEKGPIALAPDDNLLISGLIDSLDVVRLVKYIEQENDIKIAPGEITLKNFKTISAIAGFVQRKQAT